MNKFQFIKHLLDTKKFTPSQKERFFKLVSAELENVGDRDQKIHEDILLIKDRLGLREEKLSLRGRFDVLWEQTKLKNKTGEDNDVEKKNTGFAVDLDGTHVEVDIPDDFAPFDVKALIGEEAYTEMMEEAGLEINTKGNNTSDSKLSRYIDPKGLSVFLLAYNQDSVLKYTCHQIDDIDIINRFLEEHNLKEYDVKIHQEKINDAFIDLLKHHKINTKIYSLINTYLNGTQPWSSDKIIVNWKSPEMFKWCEANENMVPHPGLNLSNLYRSRGYEFTSFRSKITGQRIKSFSQLVIHFKNLFHIRADNSLKDLIEYRNKEKWNDQVNFEIDSTSFWTNIEMFTDVDKLLQAYDNVISMLLTSANKFNLPKPNVKLNFIEDEKNISLSIHHKNTVFKKTGNNLVNRIGENHTELINNLINGLCDLYLNADFDNNEYGHINLWNGKPRKITPLEKFEGVEHILLFKL